MTQGALQRSSYGREKMTLAARESGETWREIWDNASLLKKTRLPARSFQREGSLVPRFTGEPAVIQTSIHDRRLEARRIVFSLRKDASIARKCGHPELADKAEALADAITEALNTHPCDE